MITILRTASIAPGKTGDALAFARQITAYLNGKYSTAIQLMMPVGGNPNRICFSATYTSLAEWEELSAKLMTDADYMAQVASNSSVFLPGSLHDDIWRAL